MARTVDADVVLAALHLINDGLSDKDVANGALRASNARHRVRSLIQQIENQAQPAEPSWAQSLNLCRNGTAHCIHGEAPHSVCVTVV